ncbi:MAG: hypothetical protein ABIO55_07965 [Ginsengibacter sp.]
MKNNLFEKFYRATIALSLLVFACGFFIYSINSNKVFAGDKKSVQDNRTCVGGVIDKLGNISTIWSDGTVK